VNGIQFDPMTTKSTGPVSLNLPIQVNEPQPQCTSSNSDDQGTALCLMGNNGGLLGFSFNLNSPPNTIQLPGAPSSFGNFSCGSPADNTGVAICAVISGARSNALLGVEFDPRGAGSHSGFMTIGGASPDGSPWRTVSCANPNNATGTQNTVSCAVVSQAHNVYAITFDPRTNTSSGIFGVNSTTTHITTTPFATRVGASISCIRLNIDPNQITCGTTLSNGSAEGFVISGIY
jgi:hypothetical protein